MTDEQTGNDPAQDTPTSSALIEAGDGEHVEQMLDMVLQAKADDAQVARYLEDQDDKSDLALAQDFEDFAALVPIRNYDAAAPWIQLTSPEPIRGNGYNLDYGVVPNAERLATAMTMALVDQRNLALEGGMKPDAITAGKDDDDGSGE